MEAGWPGLIVEEGNLTVQIAALRKALGPREDGQDWIITVPRVGYRLLRGGRETTSGNDGSSSILPSLAVLPFQNLSEDPGQEYFADGVVEDIITALSRFRSFTVVARNSSFVYKGRAVDVRDVATQLGVRYVLEGSVRRIGGRLRVTAQLVDGTTGGHLWAKNFDAAVEEIFDVQDKITEQVAGTVQPKIQRAEIERARRKRPDHLDAYDLYLQSIPKQRLQHISGNAELCEILLKAVELDPHFGPALADLSLALNMRVSMGWQPFTHDDGARAVEFARRAILDADGNANVLATAAIVLMHSAKDYDQAVQVGRTALDTNPSDMMVIICAAIIELHCGDVERSLALSHAAIELSPTDPGAHWALTAISHAHMALGNFQEAIQWAERSHIINAEDDPTFWMLIAGHAQLGQMDRARNWLARFLVMHPGMTVSRIRAGQPDKFPDRMAAILEGLRLAGLPES
jgi:TolB-like protein